MKSQTPLNDVTRTVTITRLSDGSTLAGYGETYVPGEQLQLTISDTSGMFLWEVSTNDLVNMTVFNSDRTCTLERDGYTRTHSVNDIVVTAPTDGSTLIMKSVWALGNGVNVFVNRMILDAPTVTTVSVATQAEFQTAVGSNTVINLSGDIDLTADDPSSPFGPTGLHIAGVQVSLKKRAIL